MNLPPLAYIYIYREIYPFWEDKKRVGRWGLKEKIISSYLLHVRRKRNSSNVHPKCYERVLACKQEPVSTRPLLNVERWTSLSTRNIRSHNEIPRIYAKTFLEVSFHYLPSNHKHLRLIGQGNSVEWRKMIYKRKKLPSAESIVPIKRFHLLKMTVYVICVLK